MAEKKFYVLLSVPDKTRAIVGEPQATTQEAEELLLSEARRVVTHELKAGRYRLSMSEVKVGFHANPIDVHAWYHHTDIRIDKR
jgi:hypothetical protein